MNNKALLYNTENYVCVCVCVYKTESLCCIAETSTTL